MTNQDLLRAKLEIERAIAAVTNTLAFLNRIIMMGLPPLERADFIAEKAHAEGELIHLSLLKTNLQAGMIVVEPLQPEETARLNELASILDQAIEDSFILNATLDLAIEVLDAADEIGRIITG
jgi:hypothetical protein